MEEKQYLYDAFISYRHWPGDTEIAIRLQELLESYKPPEGGNCGRRVQRVFRDRSELRTSGDLEGDIREALAQSRYLIVVCSEETGASPWCIQEIRLFKELHQGRNDHILVVLTRGEPGEVFPEELLHETCLVAHEDGTAAWEEKAVEPLSADVRADSLKRSLKLLKTEFLRVAAPIMGCSFDDLYRRHERRRKKRLALTVGGGFFALACVLAVVGAFALRTWLSERNYRLALAESYTRQGAEYRSEEEPQEALLYCAQALTLEPERQEAAKVSAALLLEENAWPYLLKEDTGMIVGKQILKGQKSFRFVAVYGEDGTGGLEEHWNIYEIWQDGTLVKELSREEVGSFTGASPDGEYWTFCNEDEIIFYHVSTGEESRLPRPRRVNDACDDFTLSDEALPAAYPLPGGRAIAAYGGYLYLYEEKNGSFEETAEIDLAEVFPQIAEQNFLSMEDRLWVSGDGSLAVLADGSGIAVFDTVNLMQTAVCYRYHYLLNDVEIREDGQAIILVFGNDYGLSNNNSGGYLEVIDRRGNTLFQTEIDWEAPLEGAVFSDAAPDKLLVWGRNVLKFYDIAQGTEFAAPLKARQIESAVFGGDEACFAADHGDGRLCYYGLAEFALVRGEETGDAEPEAQQPEEVTIDGISQAVRVREGLIAARTSVSAFLMDEEENVLSEVDMGYPVNDMLYCLQGSELYLYQKRTPYLYGVEADEENGYFTAIYALDTRGSLITALYEGKEGLLAVTGTNQVLFYPYGQAEPSRIIQLSHSGVVRDVREVGNSCIAVEIEYTDSAPDSYHFETKTFTELWDLETKVYVAGPEQKTEADAGLSLPAPDGQAAAFLSALSCCAFDDAGNVVERTPELTETAPGNWESGLELRRTLSEQGLSGGGEESAAEEGLSLAALCKQYEAGPEAGREEEWFQECGAVWEKLTRGELSFTGPELDIWFGIYREQAEALGRLEQIEDAVRSYLELSIHGELNREDWDGYYDLYLIGLMTKTTAYDEIIAEGFERLAAGFLESAGTEDELYVAKIYTAYWLDAFAGLLLGEDAGAFEEYGKAKETGAFGEVDTTDMDALFALCRGEPEKAAEYKGNKFEYERSIGVEDDTIIYYEKFFLLQYYVLEKRGILPETLINEFMTALPLDGGIRIEEISAEAQSAGMQLGDLIVAVNGNYIMGVQHALDLFGEGKELTLKIIRGSRTVYVEKPEYAPIGGGYDIVLKMGGE